jgi:hypothetical protein
MDTFNFLVQVECESAQQAHEVIVATIRQAIEGIELPDDSEFDRFTYEIGWAEFV